MRPRTLKTNNILSKIILVNLLFVFVKLHEGDSDLNVECFIKLTRNNEKISRFEDIVKSLLGLLCLTS
jgi:hypothetical protein